MVADALKSKEHQNAPRRHRRPRRLLADDTEFETLLDYMADEENDILRRRAFDSSFQFLMIDRERDEIDLEDMWKSLAHGKPKLAKRRARSSPASPKFIDDWAFAVVEFFRRGRGRQSLLPR